MVKRIVLWKIKDDQNKQANLNLLREGLLSLNNKINDMISLEVGLNYSASDFDIVFIVAFNEPFMLKQFQCHPECVKVFQLAESVSINMVSCDYMADVINNTSSSMPNTMPVANNANKAFSNPNSVFNNNNNSINNAKRDTLATSANTNDSAFSLPYGGNKNAENAPIGFNQNQAPNQGAYNGFGNMSQSKNGGVNFTVSEDVSQIKFSKNQDNGFGNSQNSEAWKCTKCGKTNSAFINMCSCGKRRPMDNMPAISGMNPNNIDKRILQSPQDSMMLNTGIVPKMPSNNPMGTNNPMNNGSMNNGSMFNSPMGNSPMGKNPMNNSSMNNNNSGTWTCPSCGKSNNNMMKICICGHRKVEGNSSVGIPAYNGPNNNANDNHQNINLNKPMMMSMSKNLGASNVNSPNNNDFFNSFGNGNNSKNNGGNNSMNRGPMGNPPIGNSPINNRPMGNPPMGNSPINNRPNMMGGGNNRPTPPPNGMNMQPNNMGNPMINNRMGNPPFGGGNRPTPSPNNKNMSGSLPPDSWKCPRCGKVLGNFVGQCICGQRKPSRTNMHFN